MIEGKLTDADDIQNAVENAAKDNNVTLTQEQIDKISDLMKNISQYDYDVKALKNTLDNIDGKSGGFFSTSGVLSKVSSAGMTVQMAESLTARMTAHSVMMS